MLFRQDLTNDGELVSADFRKDASVLDINGVPTIRKFRIVQIISV